MFVQLICRNRNTQQKKDDLYEVLGALCAREQIQIAEKGDDVLIYACPQGHLKVTEEGNNIMISANTRHAGAGFHAFAVEFCKDIQEEIEGDYELVDDLNYDEDQDFKHLQDVYIDEITYMKDLLQKNERVRQMNYMYQETFFLPMEKEGRILTAIGDMDEKEFMELSEHELLDAFYIWNHWEKDAHYFKNAALTLLAKEGVGPYTTMNEQTMKFAEEICDYIELAHKLEPSLTLPMNEYRDLCQRLERQPKIEAKNMDEEVIQYRLKDVYHLFEDVKVVCDGACERSFDPVSESLCLMGPYDEVSSWNYLLQASKQPVICSRIQDTDETISYRDKTIGLTQWEEDGISYVEAILTQKDKKLYFHATIANAKDVPYIVQCIKESGFQPE